MKILIATTGGGHFSPSLSVIQELPKDATVVIIGRKYAFEKDNTLSLEYQMSEKLHIPFFPLTTGRLQRKLTKYTIPSLLKIPVGFFQSLFYLITFRPDVVISFGGYIGLPVCIAAFALRIPIVVHEQTLGAGLSNKIVSYFAQKVCISWESSKRYFSQSKIVFTGNPIRKEILEASHRKTQHPIFDMIKEKIPLLYITGGSTGSHAINQLVKGCLKNILENYYVVHQVGDAHSYKDYEELEVLRKTFEEKLQKRYILSKFFSSLEVATLFKISDLVISRAGINTITELLYFEKPTLLIPLPFSQDDEQLKNAAFLKEMGLAKIIQQDSATSEIIHNAIREMLVNKEAYFLRKKEKKELIKEDAAQDIIAVLYSFSNNK